MAQLQRALRTIAGWSSRGGLAFVSGILVGLIVNALSDPEIRSLSSLVNRLFDPSGRSIVFLNWVLLALALLLAAAPALVRRNERRAAKRARLSDFFRTHRLPGLEDKSALSIDGAVTLQRCPNVHAGWKLEPNEIEFHHDEVQWEPPPELAAERDRFREGLFAREGAHDGKYVYIKNNPAAFSDRPSLVLAAESVLFSNLVFYREKMFDPSETAAAVNSVVDSDSVNFPHGTSAQVVVVTRDKKVLLTQRSHKVRWVPGTWSCSLEETMIHEDVVTGGNNVGALRALVDRALREELGLRVHDHFDESATRLLSVFLEGSGRILSVPLLFVQRLKIDAIELERILAAAERSDDEFRSWVFVEPEDLLWCLKQEDASAYHPTARYRMLMYLIHHWGHDVLKQKLRADTAVNPELAAAIAPD